jgi:hypothetical protein
LEYIRTDVLLLSEESAEEQVHCAGLRRFMLLAVIILVLSSPIPAQPSGREAIVFALERENSLAYGRILFKVEMTPYGREQIIEDRAWEVPKGDFFFLQFSWSDSGQWRADILDKDEKLFDSLISDGTVIDTGEAIWEREFFTRVPPSRLGALFREIKWPLNIVENHIFPFSMIGRSDADSWQRLYKITSEKPSGDDGGSDIMLSMKDHVPRASAIEIVRIDDDGNVSRTAIGPDDPRPIALGRVDQRVILDTTNDFLPRRWEASNPRNEKFDWVVRWRTPRRVLADGNAVILPIVCEHFQGSAPEDLVWRSTIVLEESDLSAPPSSDQFTIDYYRGGSAKDRVFYGGDESKASWIEMLLDWIQ